MKIKRFTKTLQIISLCFVLFIGTLSLSSGNAHAATQRQLVNFLSSNNPYAGSINATTGNYITALSLQWGLTTNSYGAGSICNCTDGYTYYGNWNLYITNDQGQIVWQNNNPNFTGGSTSSTATISMQVDASFTPTTSLNFYWSYQLWSKYGSGTPIVQTRYLLRSNSNTTYYPNAGVATITEVDSTTAQMANNIQTASNAAQAAQTAAQGAQTAANTASTNATNAYNNTNTIINSYLSKSAGIIQDSSGNTVLSVAKAASQNALNAYNSANTAATNATNAYNAANTAATNAQNAYNATVSAQSALTSQLTDMQNNLSNNITNIQNYIAPTLSKVSGYNNATATTTNSFNVAFDYSQANEFQYKLDNGSWSSWTSLTTVDNNGYFTVSGISSTGMHTIYVQLRYNSGSTISPIVKGKVTLFKI